jgi:hypothetical protein
VSQFLYDKKIQKWKDPFSSCNKKISDKICVSEIKKFTAKLKMTPEEILEQRRQGRLSPRVSNRREQPSIYLNKEDLEPSSLVTPRNLQV